MAFRLGVLARRIAAPRALIPTRGGGGGPVARGLPPTEPLAEEDELVWHDGSARPEPCLDDFPLISTSRAFAYLCCGFGIFGLVGVAAWINNKPAKQPFADKEFPYDNLSVELGKS